MSFAKPPFSQKLPPHGFITIRKRILINVESLLKNTSVVDIEIKDNEGNTVLDLCIKSDEGKAFIGECFGGKVTKSAH